jgi:hypothetical protein
MLQRNQGEDMARIEPGANVVRKRRRVLDSRAHVEEIEYAVPVCSLLGLDLSAVVLVVARLFH